MGIKAERQLIKIALLLLLFTNALILSNCKRHKVFRRLKQFKVKIFKTVFKAILEGTF